jgi:hypothetical protein
MHDVGIIVAYTFCEALTSSSYKTQKVNNRLSHRALPKKQDFPKKLI